MKNKEIIITAIIAVCVCYILTQMISCQREENLNWIIYNKISKENDKLPKPPLSVP